MTRRNAASNNGLPQGRVAGREKSEIVSLGGISAARRLLENLLSGGVVRSDATRGRLLLEPLESRQLLAGDVDFLSTSGSQSSAVEPNTFVQFDSSGLTAEGEAANDLVAFAKALDEAGVTFFGAAWCPFCTQQKQLFEDGADFLPFVEVTNPDRTLNSTGQAEGIETFPTWDFPSGQRLTGLLTLAEISAASGIAIPQSDKPTFAPIGDLTVEVGSPLHIPIDAYDPDDASLTVTVSVQNPSLLQGSVLANNRSARISVEGWGDMVFELFEDRAPRPTGRFIELAEAGFYDKTDTNEIIFHRVIDNFVLQAGDPTGTGSGGSTLGDFDDQFHPDLQHNRTGILSYAKSLDDTNDSQFFITEGQQRHLDYNHSIFGQLVEGDAVREAISETALSNSRPTTDIVISNVEIFNDTENAIVMLKATGASLGSTDVTITVTDGDGNSYSEVITVTVIADQENAQPYLADIDPVSTASGAPATIQLQAIDLEQDPVTYEARIVDNSGATASVNQQTGLVTVTPAANFSGEILVEVGVRRSTTASSTNASTRSSTMDLQTVAVNVGPTAPTGISLIAASDTGLSNSDGVTNTAPVTFTVTGVQPGATVEILAGDTQIGIGTATATTATITTNNFAALGNTTSLVTARQTVNGVTSTRSPSITVTYDTIAPAEVAAIPSQATVGTPYSADLQGVEEGDGLRYALISGPDGVTVDSQTGVISWTPTSEQTGDQSVVIRMTDLAGNSREQSFTVNVGSESLLAIRLDTVDTNGNVITSVSPGQEFRVRVFADDLRFFDAAQGVFALYTDLLFDPTLAEVITPNSFEYASLYTGGVSGTIGEGIIDDAGAFSSQTSFLGGAEQLVFSVRMRALAGGTLIISSDPAEGSGREVALFDRDDPVPVSQVRYGSTSLQINSTFAAVNDTATVQEDSSANSISVLANDTIQTNGTSLTLSSVQTTSAQGGTVTISGSNAIYTPAANFNGVDTFTYVVRDQSNNQQTATVTVTVQPVNDPPVAVNDQFSAAANSTLNLIDVLANDTSGPDTGETLRVSAVGTASNGGTVSIGTSGANVLYTPAAGFIGIETFTYTVSDGTATTTATVTVNVGGPEVVADQFTVAEDATAAEFNVLANDQAANENVTLAIQSVSSSINGTASVSSNGSRVTYRPNANFFGTDQITYTVVDSNGATGVGTITFTVTPVNDPPFASNETVDVVRGSSATEVISAAQLREVNVDGPNETLTITSVSSTQAGGVVAITNGGLGVNYTPPNATFTGADSFTYTIQDPGGLTSTGTVTIDVIDFTPLNYLVTLSTGSSTTTLPLSGFVAATMRGTDFRGNSIQVSGAFDQASGGFLFPNQPPGTYEIEVPAMPFLFGNEQATIVPVSTSATDTSVDPTNLSYGNLHSRFLSIRDFVSTAPTAYTFAAVRPGESHAWMVATDNANTPDNIVVSLSDNGESVTITIDDPNTSGGRLAATVPITSTDMIDLRGTVDGFRILKINVNQSIASIASRFQSVSSTSAAPTSAAAFAASSITTSGSGEASSTIASSLPVTGAAANDAEGEVAATPAVLSSTPTSSSQSSVGFQAPASAVGEGEAAGIPVVESSSSNGLKTESDRAIAGSVDVTGSMSASELQAQATDTAMLDLLPQLELRSKTAESLAEDEPNDHQQRVDATLTLLGE